jgi:hypothetical protein
MEKLLSLGARLRADHVKDPSPVPMATTSGMTLRFRTSFAGANAENLFIN